MELSNFNASCIVTDYNSGREHGEESNVQSSILADDIHELSDRLNRVSINESKFAKNLEEWRNEAHDTIDKFCQSKHDEYVRRTNEEIDRLRETVSLLSSDHDAAEDYIDWVKETIQSIHQQLDELQQTPGKFSSLKIENSIICFPPAKSYLKRHPTPLKDLFSFSSSTSEITSSLSPSSPCNFTSIKSENNHLTSSESSKRSIKFPSDHWYPLAKNETNLLITGKSNIFLMDHSLRIINKKSYAQVGIKDICWAKTLSRFILIFPRQIYLLDEKNLSLEPCSITLINHNPWERGTCSETTLFLSTFGENPCIVEYNLLPSIHFNRRYQSSIICEESEVINDIKCNEISLGLIIDNGSINETRFELRSIKSFECIWSTHLGKGWGYRCSPLDHNHWIVGDSYNQRLIYISNNGTVDKMENYSTKPFNVVHWGEDQIIIRTTEGIDIHQYK